MQIHELVMAQEAIAAKAELLWSLAESTSDATLAECRRGVADQWRSMAFQIGCYVDRAKHSGVDAEMISGTREFLAYAGIKG